MKRLQRFLSSLLLVAMLCSTLMVNTASAVTVRLISGGVPADVMYVGKIYKLRVSGAGSHQDYLTYYSNSAIAPVDKQTGELTPKAPGSVTITVKGKAGRTVAKERFQVKQRATSLSVEEGEIFLSPGQTYELKAHAEPKYTTDICNISLDNYSGEKTVFDNYHLNNYHPKNY